MNIALGPLGLRKALNGLVTHKQGGVVDDKVRDLVVFYGDSNLFGSAADYTSVVDLNDPLTRVMNSAKQFVQYASKAPFDGSTGVTGRQFTANRGRTGLELQFARRYRQDNPGKELFFLKDAASGGCQSRNVLGSSGVSQITGSIDGVFNANTLTRTATLQGTPSNGFAYITGGSIPANLFAVGKVPTDKFPLLSNTAAFPSQTMEMREPGYSFEVGDARNSYGLAKADIPIAIAAIQALGYTVRLTFVVQLGVNDAAPVAGQAAGYDAAAEAFYADLRLRPGYDARSKIIQVRPDYPTYTNLAAIRAHMQANADAASDIRLVDIDGAPNNGGGDTLHLNLAGHAFAGDRVYAAFKQDNPTIVTQTVMRESLGLRDTQRMTDNG